ncbi:MULTISPECIES: type II toxin-antitoxin system RelE/ParE family toxin [Nitrospina]|uniref:Endoribonuclease HigB n=1 Tax=Nitrospina watsonii TaxID=1323948 RepID=A0ABM9HBJ1_9BACT|nr:type II toxin-antitoxin system RelE/ParE family toxin [Nitrospina watsonii]CAI2717518.1 Endoribonuclease HigB [Nitrospina watsonii]
MKIKKVRHRGLKRFIEKNDPSGLPSAKVEKVRDIITALVVAESPNDLPVFPGWRLHRLKGDRKGQWSISVTGNWRITFVLEDDTIQELNLEDYH